MLSKKQIVVLTIAIVLPSLLSGCIGEEEPTNTPPQIIITYPLPDSIVSSLVMISGEASDVDGDHTLQHVEVKINDFEWTIVEGTTQWDYSWNTYENVERKYFVQARCFDGDDYSEIVKIEVEVVNPEVVESDSHKWALFIAAANFPDADENKLGNGGLYLAEDIAAYLIEKCSYATANIMILFDDGWIRAENGLGEKIETLQQREHTYDITYGGATKQNVVDAIDRIVNQSNKYRDSELFLWIFNHGYGDLNNSLTGGKIFESSQIYLWDDLLSDRDLGKLLTPLNSKKQTIIVDACFCGGFADKTIFNIPTSMLFKSGIPRTGRVVITGASKFRVGYASTTRGPLFSLLWLEGLTSGDADGFRPGLLDRGRQTKLNIFKDGKVSVEEAFYFARYQLANDDTFADYDDMEPQINDRYPRRGIFGSYKGLILGED